MINQNDKKDYDDMMSALEKISKANTLHAKFQQMNYLTDKEMEKLK